MATLLTTTNIVVVQPAARPGDRRLRAARLRAGGAAAGRRRRPLHGHLRAAGGSPPTPPPSACKVAPAEDLVDVYRLEERLFRARVPAGSYLIDRPLAESTPARAVPPQRGGGGARRPGDPVAAARRCELRAGRRPPLRGRPRGLQAARRRALPGDPAAAGLARDRPAVVETVVVEAVLAPRSALVGKSPARGPLPRPLRDVVLAVWRGGEPLLTGMPDLPLEFGDALLLQGSRERLAMLRDEPDLIVLPGERGPAAPEVPGKRWTALGHRRRHPGGGGGGAAAHRRGDARRRPGDGARRACCRWTRPIRRSSGGRSSWWPGCCRWASRCRRPAPRP